MGVKLPGWNTVTSTSRSRKQSLSFSSTLLRYSGWRTDVFFAIFQSPLWIFELFVWCLLCFVCFSFDRRLFEAWSFVGAPLSLLHPRDAYSRLFTAARVVSESHPGLYGQGVWRQRQLYRPVSFHEILHLQVNMSSFHRIYIVFTQVWIHRVLTHERLKSF